MGHPESELSKFPVTGNGSDGGFYGLW